MGAQQDASGGYAYGPRIMPWPYSHDTNGIEYPTGIVALVYGLPDFGTWDGDWEQYCIDNAPTLIAIPESLPGGYELNNPHGLDLTAGLDQQADYGLMRVKNLGRFYRCGQRVDYNFGFPLYVLSEGGCNSLLGGDRVKNFPRVWTHDTGDHQLRDHLWGPMMPNGRGTPPYGGFPGHSGGVSFPAFYGSAPEVEFSAGWVPVYQGWRYLKARYSSTGTIAGLHVKVTRASDWSNPGGGPGGTTVLDVTLGATTDVPAYSDLSIGEVLPPLGTFGWVHIQLLATADPVLAGNMGVTFITGNRVDIPITTTIAYRDWQGTDHVIPGGYVASILADPPYTPGILTGSYAGFSAEDNGDGKFVYLIFYGTPSTTYTLGSDGFSVGGIQFFESDEATGEPESGSGPPGLGPWTFDTGPDGVAWVIIDVHGDTTGIARFRVY